LATAAAAGRPPVAPAGTGLRAPVVARAVKPAESRILSTFLAALNGIFSSGPDLARRPPASRPASRR
jgi:hypothetical protein